MTDDIFTAEQEHHIQDIIDYIGDDPMRSGVKETPERVVRSYKELYSGYNIDPADVFKTFTDGTCKEMVILKEIDFFSMCEHHMLPFFGTCSVGYLPKGKIIGISKIARLVEVFARRMQVQERMTQQIADTIIEHLNPLGVIVVAEAQHLCMVARGVKKQNAVMVTSAIRGRFEDIEVRQEFMNLIK